MEPIDILLPASLAGRVALVTGANAGLGFEAAKALYARGAHVIVAGRNRAKVEDAIARLRVEVGSGDNGSDKDNAGKDSRNGDAPGTVEAGIVDLASLASVEAFAKSLLGRARLDILLNNAGIMAPPASKTEDGYELQFGVNFLGHFALTGHLYPLLEKTLGARVVTMSSIAHRGAAFDFDNLRIEKDYAPWREYGQSKLADLVFALELHRRLREAGRSLASLAAHPGISQSELVRHLPGQTPPGVTFMPTAQGIQPALVAACAPGAKSGQYWGPDGSEEKSGAPAIAVVDAAAKDSAQNCRLFEVAEELTGLSYP